MKVLAFAATNSKKSINKQLLNFAASFLTDVEVEIIDITDFELPIYSIDLEEEFGIPDAARQFLAKVAAADALLISFAEHNGGFTVAYKNLFDWASRADRNVYQNKPVVMLATSPGKGGAGNVLQTAINGAPHFAGQVVGSLSVPSFYDVFDSNRLVLTDVQLQEQLAQVVGELL